MTLKQFLKPNKNKITIFIVLILIEFLFLIMFYSGFGPRDFIGDCCSELKEYGNFLPNGSCTYGIASRLFQSYEEYYKLGNNSKDVCAYYNSEKLKGNILICIWGIIALIINYFLSCLIIWIYDKSRKKK